MKIMKNAGYYLLRGEMMMNFIPYVIEQQMQGGEKAYDVYSRLLKDRIIFLGSDVNEISANSIVAQMLFLSNQSNEDIHLYINSPGGSVVDGMAIYDTMNYIKCDVSTLCIGMAASMSAFLLSAGTKGKRFALPNSDIMIHQPLGGARGQATDIEITARRIIQIKERLTRQIAEHCGQPYEKVKADCERDYWLSADEAVTYGLIDGVIRRK